MWYVACTRARDLLILPHLVSAAQKSWSRIVDLTHDTLPEFDLSTLPTARALPVDAAANQQTSAVFEEEGRRVRESAPPIIWRKPSDHDPDRAALLEPTTTTVEGTFDFTPPLSGGRTRGVLLHKLMEEFLAGELDDGDVLAVERRTRELLEQLSGLEDLAAESKPDPKEVAQTARQTLQFADIAALRASLVPELAVWSGSQNDGYLAGRADAVAIVDGNVAAVLDWKSDLAPSAQERSGYRGQLSEYLKATGASRGALVYMSLGEVEWITQPSR
jgi:ATP-dependent exoDNAse (exonuclease V) beta subunit